MRRRYSESDEDSLESRIGYLEGRLDEHSRMLQDLRESVRHLDDRMSRYFTWLVGIGVTTLVAVLVALITR
jgi:hypothetical protein